MQQGSQAIASPESLPDAFPRPSRSTPRALAINHRSYPRQETLEFLLSSVLRSEDHDLDQILSALEDLSRILRSGQPADSTAADEALKRAALWAVKKSLMDREVRSLAITDELTGFFNRRGFLAAATQQLRMAHRDRRSVMLLFCDLDGLKTVNDSFGHCEGDFALIRTADALEQTFRDSDVLARLGGDEFAVLAWEASVPDIEAMLARLESNLANGNSSERRYQLSLSVGIARYNPDSPKTLGELMSAADADMYRKKRNRRLARYAQAG